MITPDFLRILLPAAAAWAEKQEEIILREGVPLTATTLADARTIGVQFPEKVRLRVVPEIPMPDDALLRAAAEATGLLSLLTIGLTLRYGIYIREDGWGDRRLIAHELVHTRQYERLGGFTHSLRNTFTNASPLAIPTVKWNWKRKGYPPEFAVRDKTLDHIHEGSDTFQKRTTGMRRMTLFLLVCLGIALASFIAEFITRPPPVKWGVPYVAGMSMGSAGEMTVELASPNNKQLLRLVQTKSEPRVFAMMLDYSREIPKAPPLFWTNSYFPRSSQGQLPRGASQGAVADDGSFFVVRNGDYWTLVPRDGKARDLWATNEWNSKGPRLLTEQQGLVKIDRVEGQPIVRVWSPAGDRWEAFAADKDQRVEVTAEMEARWNAAMRREILDRLATRQAALLKRKAASVSAKIQKFMGEDEMASFAQMNSERNQRLTEIHFEFLACRRNPRDRPIFENLIAHKEIGPPPSSWPKQLRWGGESLLSGTYHFRLLSRSSHIFENSNDDRRGGDLLLAHFDQKVIKIAQARGDPRLLYYLGRVNGSVELPVPIPRKDSILRIYLAPVSRAGKVWSGDGVEKIEETITRSRTTSLPRPRLQFTFDTVTPGPIRLKAIWDKRPSFDDATGAGAGDYESDWIPITIGAGHTMSNIVLNCTNRAATGETYYAADESALRNGR